MDSSHPQPVLQARRTAVRGDLRRRELFCGNGAMAAHRPHKPGNQPGSNPAPATTYAVRIGEWHDSCQTVKLVPLRGLAGSNPVVRPNSKPRGKHARTIARAPCGNLSWPGQRVQMTPEQGCTRPGPAPIWEGNELDGKEKWPHDVSSRAERVPRLTPLSEGARAQAATQAR